MRNAVVAHNSSPSTTQGTDPWSPVRETQYQMPVMSEISGLSFDEKPLPPLGHPAFSHFSNAPIELPGDSRPVGEMPANEKL